MGILDDLFGSISLIDVDGPRLAGRRGRKLLETGERAPATVAGIQVTRSQIGEHAAETNDFVFAYALDVRGPAGTFRAGVRQRLGPQRWRAHVGAEVVVALDGEQVIVDWERTLRGWRLEGESANTDGWKVLDEPPAGGVTDRHGEAERRAIEALEPVEAVVVADRGARALGMESEQTRVLDVELRFPDGRVIQQRTGRVHPPDYARHRLRPGVVLRAGYDARRPERVRFDWLALADEPVREAPVPIWTGEPEPEPRAFDPMATAGRVAGMLGVRMPDLAAAAAAPVVGAEAVEHGASFDRWIELKAQMEAAGVGRKDRDAWVASREPAVTSWKDLDRHWSKAMAGDAELADRFGGRYSQAIQVALAGRG
jgi:hypothetical protein